MLLPGLLSAACCLMPAACFLLSACLSLVCLLPDA
jgi:hypothetical protein